MNSDTQKIYVCSIALAIALWGIKPISAQDFSVKPASSGRAGIYLNTPGADRSIELLKKQSASAVDTEWAHFMGAVDTEWA